MFETFLKYAAYTAVVLFALFIAIAILRFLFALVMTALSILFSPVGLIGVALVGAIVYAGYRHTF